MSFIVSMSRLSNWTTTRPGMVACSSGAMSTSGARVTSMPPTWIERCRGRPSMRAHSSSQRSQGERPSVEPRRRGGSGSSSMAPTLVGMMRRSGSAPASTPSAPCPSEARARRRSDSWRRKCSLAGVSPGPPSSSVGPGRRSAVRADRRSSPMSSSSCRTCSAALRRRGEELGEAAVGLEVAPHLHRVVRLERLGHAVDQRPREAQRVAHLAHRRARPVGDDVADHAGVLRRRSARRRTG